MADHPKCKCGLKTLRLTAKTAANKGRQFFRCRKDRNDGQCKFFEWDESDGGGGGGAGKKRKRKSKTSNFGQSMQQIREKQQVMIDGPPLPRVATTLAPLTTCVPSLCPHGCLRRRWRRRLGGTRRKGKMAVAPAPSSS